MLLFPKLTVPDSLVIESPDILIFPTDKELLNDVALNPPVLLYTRLYYLQLILPMHRK